MAISLFNLISDMVRKKNEVKPEAEAPLETEHGLTREPDQRLSIEEDDDDNGSDVDNDKEEEKESVEISKKNKSKKNKRKPYFSQKGRVRGRSSVRKRKGLLKKIPDDLREKVDSWGVEIEELRKARVQGRRPKKNKPKGKEKFLVWD